MLTPASACSFYLVRIGNDHVPVLTACIHTSLLLPPLPGLGAANVCALESASTEDALLAYLGQQHQQQQHMELVVCLTRDLTESHPQLMRAIMVGRWFSGVPFSTSDFVYACMCVLVMVECMSNYTLTAVCRWCNHDAYRHIGNRSGGSPCSHPSRSMRMHVRCAFHEALHRTQSSFLVSYLKYIF